MTVRAEHTFVSAIPDGPDPAKVRATDWNADQPVKLIGPALIGKATAGDGDAIELTAAQARTLADAEQAGTAAAAVAAHEALGDPHAQYLTSAEGDALFLTPAEGNAAYEALGAVAAHAGAADPHTGYQKESEKDAASGYAGVDADVAVLRAKALRETGGPTNLVVGAVADGEFLKRVGGTLVSAAIAGGSGAKGTATLDFGAFPGSNVAVVDVATVGVISTSAVEARIRPVATADHTDADHVAAPMKVTGQYLSDGNIRIFGVNTNDVVPPIEPQPSKGSKPRGTFVGPARQNAPMFVGVFSVNWAWS